MSPAGRKYRNLAVYLLFLAISLSIYSRAFDNGFRQDDHVFLRHVETNSFAESLRPSSDFTFYRPGTLILFRLVYGFFGRNSGAFIAFNFILHVTISLLVLLLLGKLFSSRILATLGAGLFLVGFGHYGKVVMWACCCGQLTSVMLSVAGILASLSWVENRGGHGSRRLLAAAILLMTSAGLFHESAIVTPAVAAIAVLAGRSRGDPTGRGSIALLLLPVLPLLLMNLILSSTRPVYQPGAERLLHVPVYLVRYAGFSIVPLQKTGMVPVSPLLIRLFGAAPVLHLAAGSALLAAMGFLAVFRRKGLRTLGIWFPLAVLPFTLIAMPEGWLQLRYLYLASIPLCGLAAAGLYGLADGRGNPARILSNVAVVIITLCTSALVLLLERHYAGF